MSLLLTILACFVCGALSLNMPLCGTRPHTRIVGGQPARHGDWPWQAMIRYNDEGTWGQWCGGSLIAPQWVVSAAHCTFMIKPQDLRVRLGAYKLEGFVGTEQEFNITRIIHHESYHYPVLRSHDIVLLKLDRPAILNRYVHPVCLPNNIPEAPAGKVCYITGWGDTKFLGNNSKVLFQAEVPIVNQTICKQTYQHWLHGSMICAGRNQGGIDTCQGDSGGPMVCETKGRYYLHGITSWGIGCAFPNFYGVYARVKCHYSWIENELANDI